MDSPLHTPEKIARLRDLFDRRERITCLTAYDYPNARIFDEAGIDMLLVGDSLGMVVLGLPDTTGVTMADMVRHTEAVARGVRDGAGRALIIADLPMGSYSSSAKAVRNARKLIAAGADCVKLEGGVSQAGRIRAILRAGISVVGHIGMLPQSIKEEGGYKKKGKRSGEIPGLFQDAEALGKAGVIALVIESVVDEVAAEITAKSPVPTIGVGAGPHCSGQVLVSTDVTGAFPWFVPPFAVTEGNVAEVVAQAAGRFIARVKAGAGR